jgi:hypothetical protein
VLFRSLDWSRGLDRKRLTWIVCGCGSSSDGLVGGVCWVGPLEESQTGTLLLSLLHSSVII